MSEYSQYVEVGTGYVAFGAERVQGIARSLREPSQVVEVIENPELLRDMVAIVKDQGVTLLGPLMGEIRAIISTSGTPRSHLGIVSREYQVPCLMGALLSREIPDGAEVLIECPETEGGEEGPYRKGTVYLKKA